MTFDWKKSKKGQQLRLGSKHYFWYDLDMQICQPLKRFFSIELFQFLFSVTIVFYEIWESYSTAKKLHVFFSHGERAEERKTFLRPKCKKFELHHFILFLMITCHESYEFFSLWKKAIATKFQMKVVLIERKDNVAGVVLQKKSQKCYYLSILLPDFLRIFIHDFLRLEFKKIFHKNNYPTKLCLWSNFFVQFDWDV